MTKSIHKSNLDTLINIKDYDSVMLIENSIQIDARYLKNWRYPEKIDRVSSAIKISFYHYLNHLRLPDMKFSESSNSLNKLSYNEYRINTITYLEQALEGLFRLITYYKYYHIKEYNKFEELYTNVKNQISDIKKTFFDIVIDERPEYSENNNEVIKVNSQTNINEIVNQNDDINTSNDYDNNLENNNCNDDNDDNDNNENNDDDDDNIINKKYYRDNIKLYLGMNDDEYNEFSKEMDNKINDKTNDDSSSEEFINDNLDTEHLNRNNTRTRGVNRDYDNCYTIPILCPITTFFANMFGAIGRYINIGVHRIDNFFYNVFN